MRLLLQESELPHWHWGYSCKRVSCLIGTPPNKIYVGVSEMRVNNISTLLRTQSNSVISILLLSKKSTTLLESHSKSTCSNWRYVTRCNSDKRSITSLISASQRGAYHSDFARTNWPSSWMHIPTPTLISLVEEEASTLHLRRPGAGFCP